MNSPYINNVNPAQWTGSGMSGILDTVSSGWKALQKGAVGFATKNVAAKKDPSKAINIFDSVKLETARKAWTAAPQALETLAKYALPIAAPVPYAGVAAAKYATQMGAGLSAAGKWLQAQAQTQQTQQAPTKYYGASPTYSPPNNPVLDTPEPEPVYLSPWNEPEPAPEPWYKKPVNIIMLAGVGVLGYVAMKKK